MKRNYKFIIEYDGSRYKGWEHQPGTPTVQGKLETVLTRMVYGLDYKGPVIELTGAGRTDGGVHARGMCANAFLDTDMTEEEIKEYMNRYLPDDIGVTEVKAASDRFHARYNATGKTYRYSCYFGEDKPVFDRKYLNVLEEKPDVERMREAAGYLIGTHDFLAFCGNASKMKKSSTRTVDSIKITENGPYITFYYHGNGFLRNQVRIMTGTLLEAGTGKREPASVKDALESRDRLKAGFTAPPQGLCLMKVDYD